ncbi:MAG: hypothetical protein LBU90_03780 [Bacteroidales bacterium]|jgi:hypothetical protein|nr:hypothetical protein [Bacteroidales bacterium]
MNFEEFVPAEVLDTPAAESEYTFETGTVSDYTEADTLLQDLQEEKQVYNQPEDSGEELSDVPTAVRQKINAAVNKTTAQILVKNGDRLMTFIMGMIIREGYEAADAEELEELTNAWAQVLPENKPVPPWVNATISTVFIYGLKISTAVKYRATQRKLEEEQMRGMQKDMEIDALRKQLQEKETNAKN